MGRLIVNERKFVGMPYYLVSIEKEGATVILAQHIDGQEP